MIVKWQLPAGNSGSKIFIFLNWLRCFVLEYTRRFFWRRVCALFIDILVIYALVTLLAAAVQPFTKVVIFAPSPINSHSCGPVSDLKESAFAVELLNVQPGESVSATLCKTSAAGLLQKALLTIGVTKVEDNVSKTRHLRYPVDADLNPIASINIESLVSLLLPLFFALMLTHSGTTIGKKILGLVVRDNANVHSTLGTFLKREYLRFFPIVVWSLLTLFLGGVYFSPADLPEAAQQLESMSVLFQYLWLFVILQLVVLVFYGVNLIRWRGKMFYDQICDLEVGRVGVDA